MILPTLLHVEDWRTPNSESLERHGHLLQDTHVLSGIPEERTQAPESKVVARCSLKHEDARRKPHHVSADQVGLPSKQIARLEFLATANVGRKV